MKVETLLRIVALPALLWASLFAADAASAAPRLTTSACSLPGLDSVARCGVLQTHEDPTDRGSRRLTVHFAVLPALSGSPANDPIVLMMGGPGEDSISAAADASKQFASLRRDHDILLVDQRGSGRSGALRCRLFDADNPGASLVDLFPTPLAAVCARRLAASADLTRYTYDYAAIDLEHVRRGLGYGPLNLVALSYGTRFAQVYMRAYPASVRTAYLGSVVPIDLVIPLTFARTSQAALERMIADCEEDFVCHRAFLTLRADVAAVFGQLAGGQVRVRLAGQRQPSVLSAGRVAEWVRSQLYRPTTAARLPKVFHQAASGDWSPIADAIVAGARGTDDALSLGLLFAITCSEDVAALQASDVPAATDGTILGAYRIRQQQAACAAWPKRALPAGYRQAVKSTIPTLFVTGDRDGDTPLWFTDHVATGFSRRAIVVVQGQGHTGWSNCLARIHDQLVRATHPEELNPTCPAEPLPPFAR